MGHGWLWWLSFHGGSPWPSWALQKWKGLHLGNLKLGGYEEFSSSNPAPHLSAELSIHVFSLNKHLLSSLCRPTPPVLGSLKLFSPSLTSPNLLEHFITWCLYMELLWRCDVFEDSLCLLLQSLLSPSSVPDPWWVPSTGLGCEWVVWAPRSKLLLITQYRLPCSVLLLPKPLLLGQQSYVIWVCHVTWHVGVISHRHIIYYPSSAVEETETQRLQSHS